MPQCGEFFSEEEKVDIMIPTIKRMFLEDFLKNNRGVELAVRPNGIKFDERSAILHLSRESFNKLTIGDKCNINIAHQWPQQNKLGMDYFAKRLSADIGIVTAFFKLKAKSNNVIIEEIFCAMSMFGGFGKDKNPKLVSLINFKNNKLLLFRTEVLEKIYDPG